MKKRQRWKLFGLIGSLCFLLVSIGATLAIVLAAMQQAVGTNISIKYVSEQVAGEITASYQIKNNGTNAGEAKYTQNNCPRLFGCLPQTEI